MTPTDETHDQPTALIARMRLRATFAPNRGYRVWLTGAIYAVAFFSIAFLRQIAHGGDMWVRIASGRYVVEGHAIPRTDPFSFTAHGATWIDHEWLTGVAMYGMYRMDYEVIVVVFALLALAPFALMHRYVLKTDKTPWLPALGVVAVAIACAWRNFPPRPALVNPLFFALLLILIDSRRCKPRAEDRRLPPVVYAIPLMWVWANLQAGFMAGLAVLAVWAAICFVERRDRRLALAVTLAAALVGLLNVYGWRLYTYTLWASVGGSPDRNYIQEWLSPDFHTVLNWPHALAILVALRYAGRPMDPFRQAMLAGALMASLLSARFQPFLAVALIFAVVPLLEATAPPSRWRLRALSYAMIPLVAVPAAMAISTAPASPTAHQPDAALAFVRREYPSEHVLATIGISNWLLYEREPVFFDGRTSQVYSDKLVSEYFDLETVHGDWEATLDEHGINLVMTEPDTDLGRVLARRGWRIMFDDDRATVFSRPGFGTAAP